MKPLHYKISTNGHGIAIGVIGDRAMAEADAILMQNIYGVNHSDHLFDHLIYAASVRQFEKFLALKEYFLIWDEHWTRNRVASRRDPALIMSFTKRAIRRARLIMQGQVTYENYMQNISASNSHYDIGYNEN